MAKHEGFRNNEIGFLQQQNSEVLAGLERVEVERDDALAVVEACEEKDAKLQSELQNVRDRISALSTRLAQDKSETAAKDEHVRVLSEQNRQMLNLLETEETRSKERAEKIRELESNNYKLQQIADEFDVAKEAIERKVATAKHTAAETAANVKGQRSMNETIRANIQNTEAKARVDIESLQQALQVVDTKNIEYLQRINKQDAKEKVVQGELEALKQEVEQVRADIDELRKQLEGDAEGRSKFERQRGQLEAQIEALEVQADTLRKALNTAERANEQLQEENRTSAERCRETADKVYALMDSLGLNQVELTKQVAENGARDKKIISLERQVNNVQAKIAMETDAKVLADQERKEAEQEAAVLKKKNRKIEESVTASQQAQEEAERKIGEMNEKVSGLQTNNAYLTSRIDGQEEEKNALKAEIKKTADRLTDITTENSGLRDEIDRLEEAVAVANQDKQAMIQELEYIKRWDSLDEAGRQRPVLIQSTDSDLLDKLQINEFLYEAQQQRNPVPPLIEKIAQLLAMLHDGQGRADQYLQDLSKSNGLVSALRQRNMALFTKTQMFESFKTRALLRYVMNLVEADLMSDMHLDGLNFGQREINEMIQLLQRYDACDKVFILSLVDNGLDDDGINLLLQLMFLLPYLRKIDLRRNCLSLEGIKRIEEQLRNMEGVTGVIRTADQVVNAHSGNQLRISIDVSEQQPKEAIAKEIEFSVDASLVQDDADPFLATDGGQSNHPWAKSQNQSGGQRSQPQAVADPSSAALPKAAEAPIIGGPPVGLGGPGNVANLNKKAQRGKAADRVPAPKARSGGRKKSAPPPELDDYSYHIPNERVLDKWQGGGNASQYQSSASRRSNSQRSDSRRSDASDHEFSVQHSLSNSVQDLRALALQKAAAGMDRSNSQPTLRKPKGRPPRAL